MTVHARDRTSFAPELAEGSAVKLIGLGGVGGIVARYLALFLASLGTRSRLVLIDGDEFEARNAQRMYFHEAGNKSAVVMEELRRFLKDSAVELSAIEEHVTAENIERLIHERDLVVLAVDNHATRKLVSDHCAARRNVVLVSGGNDGAGEDSTGALRRGTAGNCQVYVRRDGVDLTPSLGRFHPEIEQPADKAPNDVACTEAIVSTPQILFANVMAASSILNALWLHLCGSLHYGELVFDIAEGLMRPLEIGVPSDDRTVRAPAPPGG
jgi:molybdopterin/thiamine biosynthesis adenylyltransferase